MLTHIYRDYFIYLIRQHSTGLIYIGQTVQGSIQKRINEHIRSKSIKFDKIISRKNLHDFEIIELDCIKNARHDLGNAYTYPRIMLDMLEIHYIREYDSTNPKIGYNESTGGNFGNFTSEIAFDREEHKRAKWVKFYSKPWHDTFELDGKRPYEYSFWRTNKSKFCSEWNEYFSGFQRFYWECGQYIPFKNCSIIPLDSTKLIDADNFKFVPTIKPHDQMYRSREQNKDKKFFEKYGVPRVSSKKDSRTYDTWRRLYRKQHTQWEHVPAEWFEKEAGYSKFVASMGMKPPNTFLHFDGKTWYWRVIPQSIQPSSGTANQEKF